MPARSKNSPKLVSKTDAPRRSDELPPSIRICHLADIHLGYRRFNRLTKNGMNQREVDVSLAFREAVDRVIALRPDLILIAGDLFHSVRPSNAVVTFCFRELRRLRAGTKAPLVLAGGEHELPRRADTGSILRLLGEIDDVFIADHRPERFSFPRLGVSVLCIPHRALLEDNAYLARADDRYRFNVLVTHGRIEGEGGVMRRASGFDLGRLAPHEWDYLALGHYHSRLSAALNAEYPGATEFTSTSIWDEAGSKKGFLEVTLPGAKRAFHALTTLREVCVVSPVDAAELSPEKVNELISDSLASVPGGIDGKIVRLEVRGVSQNTYRLLDHRVLRELRSRALNLSIEFRPPGRERLRDDDREVRSLSLAEELRKFSESWKFEHGTADELRALLDSYDRREEEGSSEAS